MTILGQLASIAHLIIFAAFSPIMTVGNATVPADGVQFSLPIPERAREMVETRSIHLIMNKNFDLPYPLRAPSQNWKKLCARPFPNPLCIGTYRSHPTAEPAIGDKPSQEALERTAARAGGSQRCLISGDLEKCCIGLSRGGAAR
jgi:hypothetical protein